MASNNEVMACIRSLAISIPNGTDPDNLDTITILSMTVEDFIVKFAEMGVRFCNENDDKEWKHPATREKIPPADEDDELGWSDPGDDKVHPAKKPKKNRGWAIICRNDPAFKGMNEYYRENEHGEISWVDDAEDACHFDTQAVALATIKENRLRRRQGHLKPEVIEIG